MRKLAYIMILIIIFTSSFPQIALAEETNTKIEFHDMDETYWAYESIQKLVDVGIISGYPDGTFRPDGNITRAELIKITNLIFNYTQKQDMTYFTDVKSNDWFYDNVLIAQKAGYINGYPDGTFKPNGLITRQELCKILDCVNKFVMLPYDKSPADEISPWAVDYVSKVLSNRIMLLDDSGNFRAASRATRAEACDALAKFIIEEEPEESVSSNGENVLTEEELHERMEDVVNDLETDVIPNLSSDDQIEIVNDIIFNMNEYLVDNSYDYEEAARVVYKKFNQLTAEEQKELKTQIKFYNSTKSLLILADFFFPGVDIE